MTGGCDEGCSAYIFAEVVDAATGDVITGYSRYNFTTIMNASGGTLVSFHFHGHDCNAGL